MVQFKPPRTPSETRVNRWRAKTHSLCSLARLATPDPRSDSRPIPQQACKKPTRSPQTTTPAKPRRPRTIAADSRADPTRRPRRLHWPRSPALEAPWLCVAGRPTTRRSPCQAVAVPEVPLRSARARRPRVPGVWSEDSPVVGITLVFKEFGGESERRSRGRHRLKNPGIPCESCEAP